MIRRALPLPHGPLGVSLPLAVMLVLLPLLSGRAATPVVRVSVASNGTQGNGVSIASAISTDGRYVAFTSAATNLVTGDTNGQIDIFVHDTLMHTTSRALLAGGAARNVDDLFVGDVSADGRFVSFVSAATGLVAGDTNAVADGFVYDFATQQTTRISVASNGTQANGASAAVPRMSADGRFVVFQSEATNLAQPNNGSLIDVFVHDRVTHQTTQISNGVNGAAANGFSVFAQISATGRFVVFSSFATNLIAAPDTNGILRDIYVHDRQTGVTERVTGTGGVQGNGDAITAAISSDGRFVAYHSSASNLVANDTNGFDDIFLYDRQTGETRRISVSDTGTQANALSFFEKLCISANGRFVSFVSNATNLVPGSSPGTFLYDRATAHIQVGFAAANGPLSGDGRSLAFTSLASTLVTADTNAVEDAFVTDLGSLEPALPAVAVDRTALQFGATQTGAGFAQQTPAQRIRLTQSGAGSFTWTATPTQPWITVSPASGTGPAVLTVGTQFVPGLPLAGAMAGQVLLATTGTDNTIGPIAVGLTTTPNGASGSPGGSFDTPTNGVTGVTGSIAVTGWALDDIEVRAVRILRDPVPGEGSALIFIGNAVFVEGARPDVAASLSTLPLNLRAGWGYLLLTNFLPNQGDGTYRLHAIADDSEGHSIELGTKTISCANSTATRPFGAIDTPGQGEIISGAAYPNFGWVLSRAPSLAYPPHGVVSVLVDGAFTTVPLGWASRPDLTQVFPAATYPGVTNALGVAGLDTTTLSNGVHTIAWIVTADNGETEGVGSRFFTVSNGGSGLAAAPRATDPSRSPAMAMPALLQPVRSGMRGSGPALSIADEVEAAAADSAPLFVRTGFAREEPFHAFAGDTPVTIYGEEMDRFEMRVSGVSDREQLTGYTRAGSDLRPLPIGSRLDQRTGVFTWQPGPGFLGAYDLSFVRWTSGERTTRRDVRIVISPASRSRVGPQVIIDAPSANAAVTQPFMLGGWAADRNAASGTGIETLHVWAYPVERSGPPIFVGAAAYGGARPDVAALLGERFRHSGYGVIVETLPPGTYDLAIFAWSTSANAFLPAKLVRVAVR